MLVCYVKQFIFARLFSSPAGLFMSIRGLSKFFNPSLSGDSDLKMSLIKEATGIIFRPLEIIIRKKLSETMPPLVHI